MRNELKASFRWQPVFFYRDITGKWDMLFLSGWFFGGSYVNSSNNPKGRGKLELGEVQHIPRYPWVAVLPLYVWKPADVGALEREALPGLFWVHMTECIWEGCEGDDMILMMMMKMKMKTALVIMGKSQLCPSPKWPRPSMTQLTGSVPSRSGFFMAPTWSVNAKPWRVNSRSNDAWMLRVGFRSMGIFWSWWDM